MSIANKIGYGLHVFGKTTGKLVVATGKGAAKGFKHLGAGLKGTKIEDENAPVQMAVPRKRRA